MVTVEGDIYRFQTLITKDLSMDHYFDCGLYRKYREQRAKVSKEIDHRIENHPLIGTWFQRNDGILGIIEIVSRHWWFGYYEHIVYRMHNSRSHGTAILKNISCIFDYIDESAREFQSYKILDKSEVPCEDIFKKQLEN